MRRSAGLKAKPKSADIAVIPFLGDGMSKDLPVTVYSAFVLIGLLGIAVLTSMAMGLSDSYEACVVEVVEGARSERELRRAFESQECREMKTKAKAGAPYLSQGHSLRHRSGFVAPPCLRAGRSLRTSSRDYRKPPSLHSPCVTFG